MEPGGSLSFSQGPASGPYTDHLLLYLYSAITPDFYNLLSVMTKADIDCAILF
jgi:hypothetical protein